MALWFISYARSAITVTIYDVSIVIVYDVTLLLSMTYHFQSRLGKTDCMDIWVIKLKDQVSPSIGFRVPHCITIIQTHDLNPHVNSCLDLKTAILHMIMPGIYGKPLHNRGTNSV